ncbi:MAG: trypsin-like peptidase domain-containing protein [Lachnospiraceae bacterium]|nr:trypsin-like peptidase domain-containing protein [Lachnospiraceae bacterium]
MTEENKRDELEEPIPFEEEPYAFMQENIRPNPPRRRQILKTLGVIVVGGFVFGLVSGLIFNTVKNNPEAAESAVSFEEADPEQPTPEDPGTPEEMPETPTPTPTPQPEPELSPEEKRAEEAALQIKNFRTLRQAMADIAAEPARAMVNVSIITSTEDWFESVSENTRSGSGVIVGDTGQNLLILTNEALISDEGHLVVTMADGTIHDAAVRKSDAASGLVVLTVPRSDLSEETLEAVTVAKLGSSQYTKVGEPVIAIGSPVGYTGSMEFGEVTALSQNITVSDSLYTLMSTNMYGKGGSGVIIDLNGMVVGLVAPHLTPEGDETLKALAITPVKGVIERLSNNIPINYMGIQGSNITEQIAEATGMPVGVYVTSVENDSPAFAAGLQPGDIITGLDDTVITDMETYHNRLMALPSEKAVTLIVMRMGTDGYVPGEYTVQVAAR